MSLFQLLILVNGFDQVIPFLSMVPMTLSQIVISLRLLKPLKAKVFIVDTVLFHIFTVLKLFNPWNAPVCMTDIVVFHILNWVKLFSPFKCSGLYDANLVVPEFDLCWIDVREAPCFNLSYLAIPDFDYTWRGWYGLHTPDKNTPGRELTRYCVEKNAGHTGN